VHKPVPHPTRVGSFLYYAHLALTLTLSSPMVACAGDWTDAFILDLRSRSPVPNIGVVGPACGAGANWILTHDFTHKTHVAVFGLHYPRSLPDWSAGECAWGDAAQRESECQCVYVSGQWRAVFIREILTLSPLTTSARADDWITIVYRQFKMMNRREDYHVEHHLFPSRYKETNQATRLANLNAGVCSLFGLSCAVGSVVVVLHHFCTPSCLCTVCSAPVWRRRHRRVADG
jgi:hypothetical protein